MVKDKIRQTKSFQKGMGKHEKASNICRNEKIVIEITTQLKQGTIHSKVMIKKAVQKEQELRMRRSNKHNGRRKPQRMGMRQ